MRFVIAKPTDRTSTGDLFYSAPRKSEIDKAYDEIFQICLRRADREFPRHPDYPKRNGMIPQVEKELRMIKDSELAFDLLVMHEIALFSKELGYPTATFGIEVGLIVAYLLGISNVNPAQYGYSTLPSDMAIEYVYSEYLSSFEMRIAEPVRELIQHRLNKKLIECDSYPSTYSRIRLPGFHQLEEIGKLSAENGENFSQVNLETPELIEKVNNDICKKHFHCEPHYSTPKSSLELARVYAYSRCWTDGKDNYEAVKDYVFQDDIYRELRKSDDFCDDIFAIIRNWDKGAEKELDIRILKDYEVDEKAIDVYRELGNQWDSASCLVEVNNLLLLKYFQEKQK